MPHMGGCPQQREHFMHSYRISLLSLEGEILEDVLLHEGGVNHQNVAPVRCQTSH